MSRGRWKREHELPSFPFHCYTNPVYGVKFTALRGWPTVSEGFWDCTLVECNRREGQKRLRLLLRQHEPNGHQKGSEERVDCRRSGVAPCWPEYNRRFAHPFTWFWSCRDLYASARKKDTVICTKTYATVH